MASEARACPRDCAMWACFCKAGGNDILELELIPGPYLRKSWAQISSWWSVSWGQNGTRWYRSIKLNKHLSIEVTLLFLTYQTDKIRPHICPDDGIWKAFHDNIPWENKNHQRVHIRMDWVTNQKVLNHKTMKPMFPMSYSYCNRSC